MKIKPKFIQRSCKEGNKIDLRQANAVLKFKPDIIFFEISQGITGPDTTFNYFLCDKKPLKKVNNIIKNLEISSKKYPYAKSDIIVWQNIEKLWAKGINTQIYNIDSPNQLRKEFHLFENNEVKYPSVRKDWLFWVYLYLRDTYMANNVRKILESYNEKTEPTILVFLQSIHWKHVKFLQKNPSQDAIWDYYFGKFPTLKRESIEKQIKDRSKMISAYWGKIQKFY